MVNKPILSICIPTYNRGKILSEILKQYLNNSNKDFEIVVVDNNSQDESFAYLENLKDERLSLYKNENNIGSFSNIFKSLSLAKGKYVMQLMDKDLLDMKNIDKITEFLKTVDVSAGIFAPDLENDTIETTVIENYSEKIINYCFNGNHPSGVFYNTENVDFKKIEEDLKKYDEKIRPYATDFVLTYFANDKKPFIKINIDFVHFVRPPFEGVEHSFSYSPEKKNIFFVPEFRFKVFENYVKFLEIFKIKLSERYSIVKQLIKKIKDACTQDYLWVLEQKTICDWYNITEEFIEREKQKDLLGEFFAKLKSSKVFRKNLMYKFIVFNLSKRKSK